MKLSQKQVIDTLEKALRAGLGPAPSLTRMQMGALIVMFADNTAELVLPQGPNQGPAQPIKADGVERVRPRVVRRKP